MITIHMLGGLNIDCHDDQKENVDLWDDAFTVKDSRGRVWDVNTRNIIAVEYR